MRGNMAEIEVHSDHAYTNDEPPYLAHLHQIQDQSWPIDVPRQPVYPLGERPITEYLKEWARRTPTKTAINFYGRETTYAELNHLSDRVAALLAQLGAA